MFAWMNSAEALVKGLLRIVPSFSQGIVCDARSKVFSPCLTETDDDTVILFVYAKSKDSIGHAKVLKKPSRPLSPLDLEKTFFGFTRDTFKNENSIVLEKQISGLLRVHLSEGKEV